MRSAFASTIFALLLFAFQPALQAQETVVPAGTLIHCTLEEPNFSSATAAVGDPVICHLASLQEFGRSVFPRGSYLGGHLEADKDPGHFVGKGYLRIEFDRIGLPNTDIPVPSKIIGARGFRVDRQGDIVGHGHPTRDAVEWMFPVLWPWKVLALPARGPRPAIKGEEQVTLRLMDDIVVPRVAAAGWHFFGESSSGASGASFAAPASTPPQRYTASERQPSAPQLVSSAVANQPARFTLIALRSGEIYAVTNYRTDHGSMNYLLTSGAAGSVDLAQVDWLKTSQLNAQRHTASSLQTQTALSSY